MTTAPLAFIIVWFLNGAGRSAGTGAWGCVAYGTPQMIPSQLPQRHITTRVDSYRTWSDESVVY